MTLNSSGSVKGFTLIWMVPQHCFPDSETINSGSYDPSLGMKRVPIHCRRVQNTGTKYTYCIYIQVVMIMNDRVSSVHIGITSSVSCDVTI